MPCNVYILYSQKLGKYYTGISRYSAKRHRQHNHGQTHWSGRAADWAEVWRNEVPTFVAARILEKKIKARGASRFLEDNGIVAARVVTK
jgi:putative endonuclease